MKNYTEIGEFYYMKCRFRAVSLLIVTVMLVAIIAPAYASTGNDFTWIAEYAMSILNNEIQYSVKAVRNVKSSLDENIYMFVAFSPYGYAIYNANTGGFEEIAPYAAEMPYNLETEHDLYYLGPNNYYFASDNYLINTSSGCGIASADLEIFQSAQRAKEAQEAAVRGESSGSSTCAIYEPVPLVRSFDHYIEESNYFTSLLADDFGNNTLGTCTIIATAILLGYYDVYVDDKFVDDLYRSGYGTTEDFHQLMRGFICPNGTSAGIQDAASGLMRYLASKNIYIGIVGTRIGDHSAVFEVVEEQIQQGRPVVTAMFRSYNANCTMDHSNVTYGYSVIVDGVTLEPMGIYYHVHNGWKGSNQNLMTYNYAWFADAMYLDE